MLRTFTLSLLLLANLFLATAQDKPKLGSISGEVYGAKEALPSAYVFIEGTKIATTTELDGSFHLVNIPAGDLKIKITYLGFQTLLKDVHLQEGEHLKMGKLVLAEEERKLNEVEVKSSLRRGSENKAIAITRDAKQIVTVLSSEGIKKLPDKNAAETLKRIAGAAVINNKGEGAYLSLRGTPVDWTATLINGDRIPVADEDNTSRAFEFEVLPSDLVDYIIVSRTCTPDIEGDNVGGSINYITKAAVEQRTLSINVSAGFNNFLAKKPSGSVNVLWGDKSKNGKFSYVINGSFYGREYNTNAMKLIYGNNFNNAINRLELKNYEGSRTNYGVDAAIEYKPNSKLKFGAKFFNGIMVDDKWQQKMAYTYSSSDGTTVKEQDIHGKLNRQLFGGEISTEAKISDKVKYTVKLSSYYNRFFYGNVPYGNTDRRNGYFTVEYSSLIPVAYQDKVPINLNGSPADPNNPDPNTYFGTVKLLDIDNHFPKGSPYASGDHYTSIHPQINIPINAQNMEFFRAFSETNNTWEQDPIVAQQDLTYQVTNNFSLKFGTKHRIKVGSRSLGYNEWQIDRQKDNTHYLLSDFNTFNIDDKHYLSQYGSPYQGQFLPFLTHNQMNNFLTDLTNRSGHPLRQYYADSLYSDYYLWVGSTYHYQEIQNAGYVMADWKIGKVNLTGGVRLEHTALNEYSDTLSQTFKYDTISTGNTIGYYPPIRQYTRFNYFALLPSLNMVYNINSKMNLRFAESRTFHRQNFEETKPGFALIKYNEFEEVFGNPKLKPAFAWNTDLSYEFYWGNSGIFSVGSYFKWINNHIFDVATADVDPQTGLVVEQFRNANQSWVLGVEATIQKKFDFLPRAFGGIGVSANFTYSYSTMQVPGRTIHQPLSEQTPILYNVALFYEKYGITARIALNYTGTFLRELNLAAIGHYVGTNYVSDGLLHKDNSFDIYLGENYSLDFLLSYNFKKHYTVFVQAGNLLDFPYKEYRGDPNRPIRVEYYRQRGEVGFKFDL